MQCNPTTYPVIGGSSLVDVSGINYVTQWQTDRTCSPTRSETATEPFAGRLIALYSHTRMGTRPVRCWFCHCHCHRWCPDVRVSSKHTPREATFIWKTTTTWLAWGGRRAGVRQTNTISIQRRCFKDKYGRWVVGRVVIKTRCCSLATASVAAANWNETGKDVQGTVPILCGRERWWVNGYGDDEEYLH